jgi:hypothetical protein
MTEQTFQHSWSDEQLPAAVAAASSWRGVMRELGLNPANGGVTRTLRRRAAALGLDSSHFRANRSWSDAVLRQAITKSRTWDQVLAALSLSPRSGGARTLVKAHAFRLGLDVSHLGRPDPHAPSPSVLTPGLTGDLTMYLVPSRAVGGYTQILLRSYRKYIVGNAAGFMRSEPSAA